MTSSGFAAMPHVTQLPSGQWQVEMEPLDAVAKELMPDQPIVGYGSTEHEARLDGIQAFARSLNKLTSEERSRIGRELVDEGAVLAGAADSDRAVPADGVDRFVTEYKER